MDNNVKEICKVVGIPLLVMFNLSSCSSDSGRANDLYGEPESGLENCMVLNDEDGNKRVISCPIITKPPEVD